MTDTKLLVGSLSNDLMRVASMMGRGSHQTAVRFLIEAKKWAKELESKQVKEYIRKIIKDVVNSNTDDISDAEAEKYLMYGVLLQNYALHIEEQK